MGVPYTRFPLNRVCSNPLGPILRKPVERAFDVDVLLLLPRRTAGGEQQVVTVGLGALRGGLRLFNSVGSLGARMATVGASLPARS